MPAYRRGLDATPLIASLDFDSLWCTGTAPYLSSLHGRSVIVLTGPHRPCCMSTADTTVHTDIVQRAARPHGSTPSPWTGSEKCNTKQYNTIHGRASPPSVRAPTTPPGPGVPAARAQVFHVNQSTPKEHAIPSSRTGDGPESARDRGPVTRLSCAAAAGDMGPSSIMVATTAVKTHLHGGHCSAWHN